MSKIQVETDVAQYDTIGGGVFRPSWFQWWPIDKKDATQIFDVRICVLIFIIF